MLQTVYVNPPVETQSERSLQQQLIIVKPALQYGVRGSNRGVLGQREAAESCNG